LLGYHEKALTPGAVLAHSYSSLTIQGMWLNGREVGEIGMDASIAAEHGVPVVMVSGCDKTVAKAGGADGRFRGKVAVEQEMSGTRKRKRGLWGRVLTQKL